MSTYIIGAHYNGKNFVNLLANNLIREIEKETKNHNSEIQIINNKNFIVARGYTSHEDPINISKLFTEYYNELFGLEQVFNVVDLIEYGNKSKQNHIYINKKFTKDSLKESLINQINKDTDKGLDYRFTANTDLGIVLITGNAPTEEIKKYFENYNYYEIKEPTETFVSDLYFGKNLRSSKVFEFYLNYITYNIFERGLCKDIEYSFYTEEKFEDINWENIKFEVKSNSSMVNNEWLKSMILDLFTFEPEDIIDRWKLQSYNFEEDILQRRKPIWEIRDKTGEMILL